MLKRKKLLAALLAGTMMLSLVGCGKKADTPPAEAQLTPWEEASQIYNTEETDEELYQKALDEGGTVTLYSISSRCTKVEAAFEEKYPGIDCVPFDISTNELLEKVTREYDAGQHVADVVHIKDQDGSMWNEYVANKVFYNYQPADIFAHIAPNYTATATPLYIELTQLFYNTEAYPDGSPITNIWQLTEPQWKGKIMMQNPLDNLAWGSWITGFCVGEEPNRLAEAYKALYGEELIHERHRHRYEVNNDYRTVLSENGMLLSGISPDGRIVEMIEIPSHPWFVATQAHPELKSRPNKPHPLFKGFVEAALKASEK